MLIEISYFLLQPPTKPYCQHEFIIHTSPSRSTNQPSFSNKNIFDSLHSRTRFTISKKILFPINIGDGRSLQQGIRHTHNILMQHDSTWLQSSKIARFPSIPRQIHFFTDQYYPSYHLRETTITTGYSSFIHHIGASRYSLFLFLIHFSYSYYSLYKMS